MVNAELTALTSADGASPPFTPAGAHKGRAQQPTPVPTIAECKKLVCGVRKKHDSRGLEHQGRAMSRGSTFSPPAICGSDGSKPSRFSRFDTSVRARRKASFRV